MMLADDRDGARGCRGCDAARAGSGVRRVERGRSMRRRHLRRVRSSRWGGGRLRWASTVSDGSGELIIDLIFFFSVGDDISFPASRCTVSVVRGWSGFDTRAAAEASLRLRSRARCVVTLPRMTNRRRGGPSRASRPGVKAQTQPARSETRPFRGQNAFRDSQTLGLPLEGAYVGRPRARLRLRPRRVGRRR